MVTCIEPLDGGDLTCNCVRDGADGTEFQLPEGSDNCVADISRFEFCAEAGR